MATLPLIATPSPPAYAWSARRVDPADRPRLAPARRVRLGVIAPDALVAPSIVLAEPVVANETGPAAVPAFTHLEVMAVEIGKRDLLPFFRPGSRLARLGGVLFGWKPPQPLADPRLEALRGIVIALRRGSGTPWEAMDAAVVAGVAPSQIDQLVADLRPSAMS